MAHQFQKFVQFTKVEEDKDGNVIVWGISTQEEPDLDREICSYAAAVPVYQDWAEAAAQRTQNAGQEISYGPIRLQHSIEMGGKATKLEYNDDKKQIWLGSVPMTDQIRDDLRAGFYTGYSHGGTYAWRKCADCGHTMPLGQADNYCPKCKKDVDVEYGLKRLIEVSYVDSPCSGVGFDYVKANGSREFVKFSKRSEKPMELTKTQIDQIVAQVKKADEKTKRVAGADLPAHCFAYVGDPEKTDTWKLPIEFPGDDKKTERHIRNALARFEQTKGIPDDKKAEVKAKIVAAAKKHGIEVSEEGETKAHQEFNAAINKAAQDKGLKKDLWAVGRLADHLQGFAYLYENSVIERDIEGDDSEIPEELKEILDQMVEAFIAMAEEEARELAARTSKADTTKKENHMSEQNDDLIKAAKKSLAHHFAKSAAHHEKVAAHHEKAAESHNEMCDACKAAHEKLSKMQVGEEAKEGHVGTVEFTKASGKHHAEKASHHEKMAKAHAAHAEHLSKMAESHDKEESEKTLKAEREAGQSADANVTKTATIGGFSIDAEINAGFEAFKKTETFTQLIQAKIQAEVAKAIGSTIAPDGVPVGTVAKTGSFVAVPRGEEKFEFASAEVSGNTAGL